MLEKLHTLIKNLHEKTRQGKVHWERTASTNVFLAAFPNYTVHIGTYEQKWVEHPYIVLNNSDGEAVARVEASDFTDERQHSDVEQWLPELYKRAQTTAMGADKAVDDILSSLEHMS